MVIVCNNTNNEIKCQIHWESASNLLFFYPNHTFFAFLIAHCIYHGENHENLIERKTITRNNWYSPTYACIHKVWSCDQNQIHSFGKSPFTVCKKGLTLLVRISVVLEKADSKLYGRTRRKQALLLEFSNSPYVKSELLYL